MNRRKLAFAAMSSSLAVLASSIPMLGTGMGLYVTLSAWAVLGFKWWLFTLPLPIVMDVGTMAQSSAVGAGSAQVIASVPIETQSVILSAMLAAYPAFLLLLWVAQKGLRKTLSRRLGMRLPI